MSSHLFHNTLQFSAGGLPCFVYCSRQLHLDVGRISCLPWQGVQKHSIPLCVRGFMRSHYIDLAASLVQREADGEKESAECA